MADDDKANLSIALSGFANSAGGVLIFGLVAAKGDSDADVVTKEEPIKNVGQFLSEVQSLVGQAVVPIVDGVQAKAITYKQDPSLGFAVVFVPESDRGPHRATLKNTCKQYYKCAGDSFYVMEHFDLADMFGKRQRPNLRFGWRLGHVSISGKRPLNFQSFSVLRIRAVACKADIINRLNIMKASHNCSGPLFADLRKLASEEAIRELEKQKKEENLRPIKIEAIAKSVGLGAYYDSVYRLLSQDVHSQVRSLEDYVATGSEGDIGNIEWGPREEDVPTCLATAADVLIRSWMAMDQLFKQEIQSKMQEFMKDLGTMQKESSKCANDHLETGNE